MKIFKCLIVIQALLLSLVLSGCKNDETLENDATKISQTEIKESVNGVAESDTYLVHLSINPDVYFVVDENGFVVGIVTGNDDAEDVLNNLEITGNDVNTVINEWTNTCNLMGFNTRNMDMAVINASDAEKETVSALYNDLRFSYRAVGYKELSVNEDNIEYPTCGKCGASIYSDTKTCPTCGENIEFEFYYCFCGAKMRAGEDLCPVCHLYNLSGEYEPGWGPDGKEFIYCFCGEKIDSETGFCENCHLNNYTGAYEEGYGPHGDIQCFCGKSTIGDDGMCPVWHLNNTTGMYEEGYGPHNKILCFCGKSAIGDDGMCPVCHLNNETGMYEKGYGPHDRIMCFCGKSTIGDDGKCPICHLNNTTGKYDEGYGPKGEESIVMPCIDCNSTNVTYGAYPCVVCKGSGLTVCFQCGGSGTDYVTAADDRTNGWYETCSNCHGRGTWPCEGCSVKEPDYGYTCNDCGRTWSVD